MSSEADAARRSRRNRAGWRGCGNGNSELNADPSKMSIRVAGGAGQKPIADSCAPGGAVKAWTHLVSPRVCRMYRARARVLPVARRPISIGGGEGAMVLRARMLLVAAPIVAVFAAGPLCGCLHAAAWNPLGSASAAFADGHHGKHGQDVRGPASPCEDSCPGCGPSPWLGAVPAAECPVVRTAAGRSAPEPVASAGPLVAEAGRGGLHEGRLVPGRSPLPVETQVSLHVRLLN